ncbi:MAG: hypothetical protein ABGZ36_00850, partial [Actinomycetota bacterium]
MHEAGGEERAALQRKPQQRAPAPLVISDVAAVLAFVKEWREDKDDNSFQHQRYVSALIRTGKNDEAYDLIDQWLADGVGVKGEDVDKATLARLAAAIAVLRGQSRGVQRNDIPERFHKPLAKVVRVLALDDTHHIHANNIMSDYRFHRTGTMRTEFLKSAREGLAKRLGKELETRDQLTDWLNIERLYLAIVLKEEPAPVVAECWEYLGKHDPLELPEEKVLPWHEVVLLG